ncbi:MAG: DNA repair protein RadA, partial [Thermodesulfobacteriota bacterium]
NTITEESFVSRKGSGGKGFKFSGNTTTAAVPVALTEVSTGAEVRVVTGLTELDRVLGGGVVCGATVLIGGDPGIGKSTLLLQISGMLAELNKKVLYVTGEESPRQIKLRAERLGYLSDGLIVFAETSVERVLSALSEVRPDFVVIDSVQTVYTEEIDSSPGSVSQVREVAAILTNATRALDIPLFLVGHVTKEGQIAGPRVLEHMVDTVLYLEGERGHQFRILRAVKNRYGSATEIGVFEMKEEGLTEVQNPSEVFLAERPEGASGSAVVSSLEGTRTILCEIQSLISPTLLGVPRRTAVGLDYNKVLLLSAVLEKKVGIVLAGHDIYIKVAGGLKLDEPACDLGIVASMVSNYLDKPIGAKTVVFGEVGLAGELRRVARAEERVMEAKRLGFKRCIMPRDNCKELKRVKGVSLIGVTMLSEAIEELFKE